MVYQIDAKCDNLNTRSCTSHCPKHCYDQNGIVWPDHKMFHKYEHSDEIEEHTC